MSRRPLGDDDESWPPLWFKIWMVFCGVLGLVVLGVILWAVIVLVNHVTG